MKRATLRNSYLKKRTVLIKAAYNQQRNIFVSYLWKSIRSSVENLNVKHVRDNKIFLENVAFLFSNKIKSQWRIAVIENENLISSDKNVSETFHEFVSSVVKTLNVSQNPYLISQISQLKNDVMSSGWDGGGWSHSILPKNA